MTEDEGGPSREASAAPRQERARELLEVLRSEPVESARAGAARRELLELAFMGDEPQHGDPLPVGLADLLGPEGDAVALRAIADDVEWALRRQRDRIRALARLDDEQSPEPGALDPGMDTELRAREFRIAELERLLAMRVVGRPQDASHGTAVLDPAEYATRPPAGAGPIRRAVRSVWMVLPFSIRRRAWHRAPALMGRVSGRGVDPAARSR